jgi:hypothetical protein
MPAAQIQPPAKIYRIIINLFARIANFLATDKGFSGKRAESADYADIRRFFEARVC